MGHVGGSVNANTNGVVNTTSGVPTFASRTSNGNASSGLTAESYITGMTSTSEPSDATKTKGAPAGAGTGGAGNMDPDDLISRMEAYKMRGATSMAEPQPTSNGNGSEMTSRINQLNELLEQAETLLDHLLASRDKSADSATKAGRIERLLSEILMEPVTYKYLAGNEVMTTKLAQKA